MHRDGYLRFDEFSAGTYHVISCTDQRLTVQPDQDASPIEIENPILVERRLGPIIVKGYTFEKVVSLRSNVTADLKTASTITEVRDIIRTAFKKNYTSKATLVQFELYWVNTEGGLETLPARFDHLVRPIRIIAIPVRTGLLLKRTTSSNDEVETLENVVKPAVSKKEKRRIEPLNDERGDTRLSKRGHAMTPEERIVAI
eukprot:2442326-Prymnesium_polylepis.1